MTRAPGGLVKVALKLAVAAALIAYVVHSGKLDLHNVGHLLAAPAYFGTVLVLLTVQLFLIAWRLQLLLRARVERLSFSFVLRLTYLGAFFDAFALTSVGGDAVKAWYLSRALPAGTRTETLSILVVDRFLGLLGMLALTVAATAWNFPGLWAEVSFRPYLAGLWLVCAALILGAVMLFSKSVRQSAPLRWFVARLPFSRTVQRAYASMDAFSARPQLLLEGGLLSVAIHALGTVAHYVLVLGLNMPPVDASSPYPSLGLIGSSLLMTNFVCSFASFGGVGVGQAAYDFVFERAAHLRAGADLATASQLAFFLIKLPGLFFWLTARQAIRDAVNCSQTLPD
jgi:uncharacterized membrane protein YbhN (UPF0104 family)